MDTPVYIRANLVLQSNGCHETATKAQVTDMNWQLIPMRSRGASRCTQARTSQLSAVQMQPDRFSSVFGNPAESGCAGMD